MCFFQHNGKQNRTHARTSMVKIALRKLVAGILCGCVVLLALVAKWVKGKKTSKPIHILTALFTTRVLKENKQANIICCMCIFQHVGKQDRKHARTNMVKNCVAQVVFCWYFVRLCGTACWLRSERWKLKPSKPIHILTALFTTRVHKENKQILPYQPTLLKTLANTIYCMCLFQHNGKQEMKLCKNKHGENCIAQVVCWYFVRLCGAAGVGCEVSEGKTTIQTYPYSNCTFHQENSQRVQTSFTVPTNLGKTLANIIHCMCFFQHNGKQNRTHARTSMVKIALRKLFAGILCGCVVLLVLVAKWVREKKPSKPIHILTALFIRRIHKENKQVLPYQPTSGKLWPT